MVVLTELQFRFSLFISQLLAKAIPVRGAKLEKPAQGNLSGLFAVCVIGESLTGSDFIHQITMRFGCRAGGLEI